MRGMISPIDQSQNASHDLRVMANLSLKTQMKKKRTITSKISTPCIFLAAAYSAAVLYIRL